MRWKLILGIVLGFWIWFYLPKVLTADQISIRARPQAGMVPFMTEVVVKLERDERNRELCLAWNRAGDPAEFTASSCYELADPMKAAITHTFRRTLREPGEWLFVGAVRINDGSWARTPALTVIAAGGH